MNKKDLYIIISLTVITVLFGSSTIHLYLQVQDVALVKEKINQYEKQGQADKKKLAELEKRLGDLKNELDYFADIPKNPLYEDYKKRVTALIGKNFTQIISKKQFHSGQLFMTQIRFVDPSLVTVKYEDGHNVYESYIRIIKPRVNFQFEEVK